MAQVQQYNVSNATQFDDAVTQSDNDGGGILNITASFDVVNPVADTVPLTINLAGHTLGVAGFGDSSGTVSVTGTDGASILQLTGTNTFGDLSGTTSVIAFDSDDALGSGNTVTLTSETFRALAKVNVAKNIALAGQGATIDTAGHTLTVSGVISGGNAAPLIVAGGGTLLLSNTNTYTGATTINVGTLALGSGGSIADSSVVDVAKGATFDVSSASGTPSITGLSGAGDVTLGGKGLTLTGDGTNTFAGVISGYGSLTEDSADGAGMQILSAANTYSGGTDIKAGVLVVDHVDGSDRYDSIGALGSTVTLDGGTLAFDITGSQSLYALTTASETTSTLGATNGNTVFLQYAKGSSSLNLSDDSTIIFGSEDYTGTVVLQTLGSVSSTAAIEIGGGTLRLGSNGLTNYTSIAASTTVDANATLDLNDLSTEVRNLLGTAASASVITGISADTVLTLDAGDFAGVVSGSGSITKATASLLTLTGDNTYSAGTSLNDGTLELGQITSAGTGDITFGDGAQTLRLDTSGKLGNQLDAFGTGDTVDLQSITRQGATLTTTMSGGETTVTVTEAGLKGDVDTFTANTVSGYHYALSSDADSATVVLVADASSGGGGTSGPTPGDDNLAGTSGSDTVSLLTGNDRYSGLGGNDLIYGNQGNDLVYGNQGNDRIYGGMDRDTAYGGQGADIVYGNKGDDVVYGNMGADALYGGQGNDTVYGGQGNDILFGNKGDDVLVGGLGSDTFAFNAGDTDFRSNFGTGDTISDFVSGTDKVDFTQGPAATAQNFGSASTTATDFASIQALAQQLINAGDAYAFVADGTDGFLFTTGGTGTAIADAVKLTGAGQVASLKATDITHGPAMV